ncbi:MAG: YbaN family protein [Planctomycetia bacterium]|nr:YbaN family protein [Planctomycetia bacterium]
MSDRLDPQDPAFDREPPTEGSSIKPLRGMRRVLYLAAAGLFFGLSIVGILLPGVPTVPFLLLTSFFLLRSSPALNERLLRARSCGPGLRDGHRQRGVRRRV